MNRYQRPLLRVGAADKKIFLKTASKKKKIFVFLAIISMLAVIGSYKFSFIGAKVDALLANKNSPQSKAFMFVGQWYAQAQETTKTYADQVRSYFVQRKEHREQKVNSMLRHFSKDENISKVIVGESWVGQTLFEKHALSDFVTVKLNKFYQANRNAYILAETSKEKLGAYPILTGPWSHKGTHQLNDTDRDVLFQGVELMALFNQYDDIKNILSEANYSEELGWVLFSTSPGIRITLGKNDFKHKTNRLLKVMQQYEHNIGQLKSIDLDYQELAIIKLRKGDSHGQS